MLQKPRQDWLQPTGRPKRRALQSLLLVTAVIAIFIADTITDYEIAVAVFYVVAVLIAAGLLTARGVHAIWALCVSLTLASFILTKEGAYEAGIVNCMLSVTAIGATAYLALQRSSALHAEHQARTQLTRLSRVNTLGEMAASIAHEVNQPLTGIIASGGACRNWLAAAPPNIDKAQQAVGRMIADAHRASEIVDRVRNMSKRAAPRAEWIDAEELVDDVLALVARELDKSNVRMLRETGEGLILIFADPVQIRQVMVNLILNALEAISVRPQGNPELAIHIVMLPDNMAQFTVSDTGPGFDLGQLEQMFDPFFSTKEEGIGMGLAISRSIVETHGGRIWAEPNAHGGTRFHFSLPARKLGAA